MYVCYHAIQEENFPCLTPEIAFTAADRRGSKQPCAGLLQGAIRMSVELAIAGLE